MDNRFGTTKTLLDVADFLFNFQFNLIFRTVVNGNAFSFFFTFSNSLSISAVFKIKPAWS